MMRKAWGLEGGGGNQGKPQAQIGGGSGGGGVQLDQPFTPYPCTRDLREPKDWAEGDKDWLGLEGTGHCESGSEAVQQRALAPSNHLCVGRWLWRGVGAGWGPRQGECQTGFYPAITALAVAI